MAVPAPTQSVDASGPNSGRVGSYRSLIWLAAAAFSSGIDGYVLAGLLPTIAVDLGVSSALAGQLVTVFALTSVIGGPLLGTLTSGWERRGTIAIALTTFIIGNVLVAVAPAYAVALVGRVVSALGACLMTAAISSYVVCIVAESHRGRALSLVMGGWMAATAFGVPVGLVLGQTSWRFPLIMVAVVGTIALLGIMIKLPRLHLPPLTLRERLAPLRHPRLVAGLLVSTGILCASYVCFTYAVLIFEPFFGAGKVIVAIMFGYGLFSMLGNAVTGRLVDRFTPFTVLTVILVLLAGNAIFGAFVTSMTTGAAAIVGATGALVWFFVASIGNGGHAVPQQARLAAMAPESAAIVMALNGSAVALGLAMGSSLGGGALVLRLRPDQLPLIAAAVLLVTLILHRVVGAKAADDSPAVDPLRSSA